VGYREADVMVSRQHSLWWAFRFSLRTAGAALTLIALGLGVLARIQHQHRLRWRNECRVMADIRAAGGHAECRSIEVKGLWARAMFPQEFRWTVHRVGLRGVRDVGRLVRDLEFLPNLDRLWMLNSGVRDEDLRWIAKSQSLTGLELSRTHVTDQGLRYLYSMERLKDLNLSGTDVSEEGWQRIRDELCRRHPFASVTWGRYPGPEQRGPE
jgi:hypothetical protein